MSDVENLVTHEQAWRSARDFVDDCMGFDDSPVSNNEEVRRWAYLMCQHAMEAERNALRDAKRVGDRWNELCGFQSPHWVTGDLLVAAAYCSKENWKKMIAWMEGHNCPPRKEFEEKKAKGLIDEYQLFGGCTGGIFSFTFCETSIGTAAGCRCGECNGSFELPFS